MTDKICYSNKGMSMRYVPADYVALPGETLFSYPQTSEQLAVAFDGYESEALKADIVRQISIIEKSITSRERDEFILGISGGQFEAKRSQITALREQLA